MPRPGPPITALSKHWADDALCASGRPDADLFRRVMEIKRVEPGVNVRLLNEAKAVCARCPVFADCATYANTTGARGLWAGVFRTRDNTW